MSQQIDDNHTIDLGAVTAVTTGVGPIPEFNLGQHAALLSDD